MLQTILKIWFAGTRHKTHRFKRQILLSNQLAFFACIASLPYVAFFACYDFEHFRAAFVASLSFMLVYITVPCINALSQPNAARNIVLGNVMTQLVVTNYFVSTGAGVNLYFLTIISILPLIFHRYRPRHLLGLGLLIGALFVVCELLFPPGSEHSPVPASIRHVMYIASAVGSIGLTGIFAYLFRLEIANFETELRDVNHDLRKLSTTDELTRLVNRRGMDAFLEQEWARVQRTGDTLSVVMCDVDYFKAYNDHYGHPAGDAVLQQIAVVLADAAQRPSDLVARYGGEEFALILPHTDASDSRLVGERILHAIRELAIAHEKSRLGPSITVSIGYSTVTPGGYVTIQALLQAADRALYLAKRNGRNCMAYEPVVIDATAGLQARRARA